VSTRILISENEKNRILSLYQIIKEDTPASEGTVTFITSPPENNKDLRSAQLVITNINDQTITYNVTVGPSGELKKELPFGNYEVNPPEKKTTYTFDLKTFPLDKTNPNVTVKIQYN